MRTRVHDGYPARRSFILALVLAASASCGPPIDLKASLHVGDVSTGWFDHGIVGNQNKLVPSIAFTLANQSGQEIASVQLNIVFRRAGEAEEWDAVFLRGIESSGLAPGETSSPLVVRATLGYTGEQPRAEMLRHSQFVDAKAKIFAKHGSAQWVLLGEFDIERQLLTR